MMTGTPLDSMLATRQLEDVLTFSATYSTETGQAIESTRRLLVAVPRDRLKVKSIAAAVAVPPTGDHTILIDVRCAPPGGKPAPFAAPLTIGQDAKGFSAVESAVEDHELNQGDILELSVHVTGTEGYPGSGLLVTVLLADCQG